MEVIPTLLTYVGVTLPKQVYIQNHRLGFVLLFCRIFVIVVWLVLYAGDVNNWCDEDIPIGVTTMRYMSFPDYNANAAAEAAQAEWCDHSRADSYQYDWPPDYVYTNYLCRRLPSNERWVKGESEIFIPTMFEQKFVDQRNVDLPPGGTPEDCDDVCYAYGVCPDIGPDTTGQSHYTFDEMNGRGQCLCRCEAQQDIFATGIGGMVLVFHHQALSRMVPAPDGDRQPEGTRRIFADSKSTAGQEHSVGTVVRDQFGEKQTEFEPGRHINVTLHELLGVWGGLKDGNFLDPSFVDGDLTNSPLEGRLADGYNPRVTGLDVDIVLNYNYNAPPFEDKPTCNIQVRLTPKWLSRLSTVFEIPEDSDGMTRYKFRYLYGIRIHFSVQGKYMVMSYMKILGMLADLIVYLQVPTMIIMLISRYSLGQLSEIYYKAQVQILDIGSEFYGLISRALVAKQAYDAFLDTQGEEYKIESVTTNKFAVEGLNPHTVKQHLRELLKTFDDLDDNEITIVQRVLLSGLDPEFTGRVTRQKFVEMCTNDDETNLGDLAKIFDVDRKRCCLEAIFDSNRRQRDKMGSTTVWEDGQPSPRGADSEASGAIVVAPTTASQEASGAISVAPTAASRVASAEEGREGVPEERLEGEADTEQEAQEARV